MAEKRALREQNRRGFLARGGNRQKWFAPVIQESILDVCATVQIHFVIADGIVAMEGNGPLNGTARSLETIVLADDPIAADATCSRLMGFEPSRITYICEGSKFLGNTCPALIDQV